MEMVRLDRLTKQFGAVQAVSGVSFSVGRGEVVGFLGPNGAGKSTTMRMLTGFVSPSSGTASVMDCDIVRQPILAKRQLGYLPEGAPAYGDMTVTGFLRFIAEMRGFRGDQIQRRIGTAVDRADLGEVIHRPIETLSKGFKRRVGLAQAILHDPPVLIMDEPTDGLDPNQKHEVRALIRAMSADKAIIVSTHILEEVDAVCSRAIVIDRGRVVADTDPESLRRRSDWHNSVRLTVADETVPVIEEIARGIPAVAEVRRLPGGLVLRPRDGAAIAVPIAEAVRGRGVLVQEMVVEPGRLDDVFRELTGHQPAQRTLSGQAA